MTRHANVTRLPDRGSTGTCSSATTSYRFEEDLSELTGKLAAGRLAGRPGARYAAAYLALQLAALGAEPVTGASYFQPVDVPVSYLTGIPSLVVDGRSYKHGLQFTQTAPMSTGGHAQGRLLVVRRGEDHVASTLKGRVVLIPRDDGKKIDAAATADVAASAGVAALLIESTEKRLLLKSSFFGKGRLPILRLSPETARSIEATEGAIVEIDLPLKRHRLPCNNVLGLLSDTGQAGTIALAAHYDHIGDDPGGHRYPGAVDNAAGVVAVLEAARRLNETQLPFRVLIAFLTGEESGLVGAKHLAKDSSVPLSAVVNFDVLGSEPKINAMRIGHAERGHPLAESVAAILENRNIEPVWKAGGDDAVAFNRAGIPAIGLRQQATGETRTGMHVPTDTFENLHLESIDEGAEILVDILTTLANEWGSGPDWLGDQPTNE